MEQRHGMHDAVADLSAARAVRQQPVLPVLDRVAAASEAVPDERMQLVFGDHGVDHPTQSVRDAVGGQKWRWERRHTDVMRVPVRSALLIGALTLIMIGASTMTVVPIAAAQLPGEVVDVVVAGRGGVPSDGVGAVVLNLTATDVGSEAFATV